MPIYSILNNVIFDPVIRQLFRSRNRKYKISLVSLDIYLLVFMYSCTLISLSSHTAICSSRKNHYSSALEMPTNKMDNT